jgi:hypothetical protein
MLRSRFSIDDENDIRFKAFRGENPYNYIKCSMGFNGDKLDVMNRLLENDKEDNVEWLSDILEGSNQMKKLNECCLCNEIERYNHKISIDSSPLHYLNKNLDNAIDNVFMGIELEKDKNEYSINFKIYCSYHYIEQLGERDSYLNYIIKNYYPKTFEDTKNIRNNSNYMVCSKWRIEREKKLNKNLHLSHQFNDLNLHLVYNYFSDNEILKYIGFIDYNPNVNEFLLKSLRKRLRNNIRMTKDLTLSTEILTSIDLYKIKVRKIEEFFLKCKYSPYTQYGRNFINGLYDENYN